MIKKKFLFFVIFFVLGLYYAVEVPTLIAIFLSLLLLSFVFDSFVDIIKNGFNEAEKVDGYYPEDKLKEYYANASKRTAEYIGPDHKSEVDYRTIPHRSPNMAKNFFSELEKLFK